MYSCHLFLISSASVRSIPFLSFIEPIFAWNIPLVSLIFLKRPLVFPFYCFPLFLCIAHWGRLSCLSLLFFETLHSNGYIFCFLLCLLHLFFSQMLVRPPQTTILPFCIFSWGWSWSLFPVQCHEPPSIVLQALYQIWPLESIFHFHCIIVMDFIWVIPECSSGFPFFLQFKSEFCNKDFMIWDSQLLVLFLLTV